MTKKKAQIEKMQAAPAGKSAAVFVMKGREFKFDAFPDTVDIRDWFYQPTLDPLPEFLNRSADVPEVLDQGRDGACTGFALAAVIQFLLRQNGRKRRVSPWMLYEMARRYDEWPGEEYEGSSARGAMKGWVRHGVCPRDLWSDKSTQLDFDRREKIFALAQETPGGAFYRVMHRQVRDMHSALNEVGILYCTLLVHVGWAALGDRETKWITIGKGKSAQKLPVIRRLGRPVSGHAVAIVGYTRDGFIVQNSWGGGWGARGFALLPYDDYLLHATDVWVAQLGVPLSVDVQREGRAAGVGEGMSAAAPSIPLTEIRPYVVDLGNNGELSLSGDYWTTAEDVEMLVHRTIPNRTASWARRRLLLYLHGGLNDEGDAAKRIVALRDVMLANEVYPLHIMWETGPGETLLSMIGDLFTRVDDRARGVGDWFRKLREGAAGVWDWTLERTLSVPGSAMWREMKENARIASRHPANAGGLQILCRKMREYFQTLSTAQRANWELHVVAHSAGSIFLAYGMRELLGAGIALRSVQMMAPAMTVDLFAGRDASLPQTDSLLARIQSGDCPHPTLYVLNDRAEQDDHVGQVYRKSLLFLVSNSFEPRRATPLLGMERFLRTHAQGGRKDIAVDPAVEALFQQQVNGRPSLVVTGTAGGVGSTANSRSHGGFDNDADTMNSVLHRILGHAPPRPFTRNDLKY